jgi:hypothetical protein
MDGDEKQSLFLHKAISMLIINRLPYIKKRFDCNLKAFIRANKDNRNIEINWLGEIVR